MFHMSPSQGSLLHESVARSRELGRSIGRPVARSLGIGRDEGREARRERREERRIEGEEQKDTGATNPNQKKGFDCQKNIFTTTPDTIKAKMDKIRSGGSDYESVGGFDCFLIVLIRFILFASRYPPAHQRVARSIVRSLDLSLALSIARSLGRSIELNTRERECL